MAFEKTRHQKTERTKQQLVKRKELIQAMSRMPYATVKSAAAYVLKHYQLPDDVLLRQFARKQVKVAAAFGWPLQELGEEE